MNSNNNQTNKNNKNNTISPITIARNKNDNTPDQGWTVKNSANNKRNHSTSSASEPPSPSTNKQIDKNPKKKIFVTQNRYLVLSQDENQNHDATPPSNPTTPTIEQIDEIAPIKPPPPVFVKGVADFPELCKKLIEIIGVDNFVCKASADKLKIQTSNSDSYRTLVRYLKEEKAQYHTYQLREDKPLRIVIRNLHPSTPAETIKEELELLSFEVRQVINVLHKVNKNPLPLFFVDLEPTYNSSEIFHLSSLLHTKIKIEEPFKPKSISQCHNCQQYGHTKAYCGYQPRCVRCGLGHLSSVCPNSRELPTKCALCSQNHPANYKGCTIYKELQRRKKPSSSSNPRGTTLHNFINLKKYKVLAPPAPTYWPSSLKKKPDILDIFVTKLPNTLYSNTKNILDLNSDHSSVLLTLNTSPPILQTSPYLFNRFTDRLKFHDNVNENIKLNIKLKTPDDIDLAVKDLTNIIQIAAWSASNNNSATPHISNPLPEVIRTLITEKRKARACYQRTRLPSHKKIYNQLANSLKKTLAKHKNIMLINNLTNLSSKDGSLWKATKKILRYKAPNIPLIKHNGSLTSSDSEKAELFKIHLSEIFLPHPDIFDPDTISLVNRSLNGPPQSSLPIKPFSPNDLKYQIKKYPRKNLRAMI
ncbi:hypothetical protein QTP88_021466 [Uroleucon formosanum]